MLRVRADAAKASNLSVTSYSPIARSLLVIDDTVKERMKKKFDICYVLAKENIGFLKYAALHELEERHGVDLGFAYKNDTSAKTFTHYIAKSQRQSFLESLSTFNFYSFLMDGSTDAGNIEEELVIIQYCNLDDAAQEMRSCTRFLSLEVPAKADADGLINCLSNALGVLGVDNILDKSNVLGVQSKPVLVGGGTDGASVNIGEQNGMRGKLQKELPWLYWTWCYAHRLELACKDAFRCQLFKDLDEMLLRLYSLYSKSPKKSRELTDLVEDLMEVWDFPGNGDLPVRSQGTRWITHKRKALQRLVDRYGAYINHVITLSEDQTMKDTDRARLKGFLKKWNDSRMLIGAAMYVDALKAPSLLSLTLHAEKLDIVLGIQGVIKSSKSLKKLAEQDPLLWPTVKLTCSRVKEENGENIYQGAVIRNYNPTNHKTCANQVVADVSQLETMMETRLEWSDMKMLRAILVFLETQSWPNRLLPKGNNSDSEDKEDDPQLTEIKEAGEYIISHFREPLEAKNVTLGNLQDEIEDVVLYARKYLGIGTECYQKIWYKLHKTPDAVKWPNVLRICELLFSLPFSNGHVERMFSVMKVIKTEKRARLRSDTLSDLLEVQVEGLPLASFSADRAVLLWWEDCKTTRRVNQVPRKKYRERTKTTSSDIVEAAVPESDNEDITLDDWDSLFGLNPEDAASQSDSRL